MRNILVINSSFRKNSNSTFLSNAIATGATKKGHTVTTIDVAKHTIQPCKGCMGCLVENAEFCVTKDDMHKFYPFIEKADTLIFASPIYWFTMSGQLKLFLDRCFAIAVSADETLDSSFKAKTIATVFTYEGSDPVVSGCINAIRTFQDICAYTGATWAGSVYGTAFGPGDILSNHELLKKAEKFGESL